MQKLTSLTQFDLSSLTRAAARLRPTASKFLRHIALPLLCLFAAAMLVQICAATPGEWELTGSLHDGRSSHAATLLQNGMVLVNGGESSDDRLAKVTYR